jgi:two-component system, NarL family, response regulator DevR
MDEKGVRARVLRLAHIDDHETVQVGLASLIASVENLELVVTGRTVAEVLPRLSEIDLVVLDLRLPDGSTIAENLAALHAGGARVLAFTAADNAADLRAASRSGVLGIVRKSEPREVVVDAIQRAAMGESIATTDWAAAIDADPQLASASLSPKEREVLGLYAAGDKSTTVAARAGLSTGTVAEYVRRIRSKYAAAGRPAHTKIDLYKRAVEDGILPSPEP